MRPPALLDKSIDGTHSVLDPSEGPLHLFPGVLTIATDENEDHRKEGANGRRHSAVAVCQRKAEERTQQGKKRSDNHESAPAPLAVPDASRRALFERNAKGL
mmetsp:Transcript_30617/g.93583  ORF Transcript_30617/g.93583 Transcript_30617/m.93583 type:complete len:102 (-) Transcript_30617:112-417(-)|eukprot:CAMPEP_0198671878 /NCGR_PEP_ID=MMETSP1467-20131203/88269_1 /TAXON_ID=1462469 /ORGANISM="unid. sp., Strain CCMP2135" /LENGTH=101 /DNA_ID=CAMNT_0044408703 /DNA_START=277 /DNA_END=582 /DNA_ORIENTATION=-